MPGLGAGGRRPSLQSAAARASTLPAITKSMWQGVITIIKIVNISWAFRGAGHCSPCFTHHSASPQQQPDKVGVLLPPFYRWGRGTGGAQVVWLQRPCSQPIRNENSICRANEQPLVAIFIIKDQAILCDFNFLLFQRWAPFPIFKFHLQIPSLLQFKPLELSVWGDPHFTIKSVLTTQHFKFLTAKAKSLGAISEFLWFPLVNSAFRRHQKK